MELDELARAWSALDTLRAEHATLVRETRRERASARWQARLRRLTVGQVVQLVVGAGIVLWAGGYWWSRLGTPHLVVYGLMLHAWGLALVVSAALQVGAATRVDLSEPVTHVQARLLALRRLRIASERVLLFAGFLAWAPFSMIVAHALGWDAWRVDPFGFWLNVAVAVALAAFALWLTYRFRAAFERDASGRALAEVERDLAELSR